MKLKHSLRRCGAVLAALAILSMQGAGCDNSRSTGPGGPTAVLLVTFEPNPSEHVAHGEWLYTVLVTETAGVGVYIYGWVRQGYSTAGEKYATDSRSEIEFIEEFGDCGGEGNYLEARSTRCSSRRLEDRLNTGWQTFTFYGVDDFGNEVSGEGRLDLL